MSVVPVRTNELDDFNHKTSEIVRSFAIRLEVESTAEEKVSEKAQECLSEISQIAEDLKNSEAALKVNEKRLSEAKKRREEKNVERSRNFHNGRVYIPQISRKFGEINKDIDGIEAYFSRAKEYFGV